MVIRASMDITAMVDTHSAIQREIMDLRLNSMASIMGTATNSSMALIMIYTMGLTLALVMKVITDTVMMDTTPSTDMILTI